MCHRRRDVLLRKRALRESSRENSLLLLAGKKRMKLEAECEKGSII